MCGYFNFWKPKQVHMLIEQTCRAIFSETYFHVLNISFET